MVVEAPQILHRHRVRLAEVFPLRFVSPPHTWHRGWFFGIDQANTGAYHTLLSHPNISPPWDGYKLQDHILSGLPLINPNKSMNPDTHFVV
ncbi:hypothetical protein [Corynebacterium mycetoides]|uniref:hypothetical protein n=1 Tax=Corynebacterium mycetoides TaxID=38302 RepID=UPI00155FF12C|nr:hypothetical protein [Corynebacterium mycetoides]